MSKGQETERDRAETEAATWLVMLAEDPDDRDLASRFEAWRSASPLHAELWARTTRAYDLAGTRAPSSAEVLLLPRTRRPSHPRRLKWVVAAAMAVAACLLLLAGPAVLLRMQADHVTATAEVRPLVLDDGTEVRLGPESALAVDFTVGERRVRLLKGMAFFEVVPQSGRPFSVVAGDVVTTVLGTAFEVRLGEADVGVSVRHGRVRVDDGARSRSENLVAGEWLTVPRNAAVERGRRPAEEIGDWTGGSLVARNRPVSEIVDVLRRYYDGRIVLQDATFAATRVTGIYDLRDPAGTLANLASSHGASVHRLSPWLLVVTAK